MALKANQITTDKVRLSYVHLDKPYAHDQKATPKYSVTVLLPKSDIATKARLDAAYQDAVNSGVANKWNGALPPIIANPIYDGDGVRPNGDPFGPECKGHWVFTAGSTNPVAVVDAAQNPIINTTDVYSGCYARVCVSLFAYNNSGKRGIGCGLEAVQKLEDGDPLGGGVSIADAFGVPAQVSTQQYPQQPAPNYAVPSPAPQYPQQPAPNYAPIAAYDPITGTYR